MFDWVVMCALIDRGLLHLSYLGGGRNITSAGRNQQMGKAKDIKRWEKQRIKKDGKPKDIKRWEKQKLVNQKMGI